MSDILIIDNEFPSQITLKTALKNQGFICEVVEFPREALEKIRVNSYKWIVCDIKMGHIDAFDLSKQLREADLTSKAGIVITSAFLSEDEFADAEIDAFVEKPIDIVKLRNIFASTEKNFKKKKDPFVIDVDPNLPI